MKTRKTDMNLAEAHLTEYQQRYWKNPDHYRQVQRDKYSRYPDRIKEINKGWADKNAEYLRTLRMFNSQIFYWRNRNNESKVQLLTKAKEEFKFQHRLEKNRG